MMSLGKPLPLDKAMSSIPQEVYDADCFSLTTAAGTGRCTIKNDPCTTLLKHAKTADSSSLANKIHTDRQHTVLATVHE